jgi:SAM-dependent methyltransferase
MADDAVAEFKQKQKEVWALGNFGEVAVFTTITAGHLVRFAGVKAGQTLLDVGCGTGPVSITAALKGAKVTGLDLTPELLTQARASAPLANVSIDWKEGDAEALPFGDSSFDVVLSQFGHMFAPRPDVAIKELLRVLKPGGRIAFATWPPDTFIGRAFMLSGKYVPPPPGATSPPVMWGDFNTIRDRLGSAVKELLTERGQMPVPTLSAGHFMAWQSAKIGPFIRTMGALQKDPAKRDAYIAEYTALVNEYLVDNILKHEYVLTRAIKV